MKIVIDADPGADLVVSDGQITVIGYKSVQILPDTHAAPEEPERKPPQRLVIPQKPYKDIDMGKARALRAAGWSFDAIGDELGVSGQTIANRLRAESTQKEDKNT